MEFAEEEYAEKAYQVSSANNQCFRSVRGIKDTSLYFGVGEM